MDKEYTVPLSYALGFLIPLESGTSVGSTGTGIPVGVGTSIGSGGWTVPVGAVVALGKADDVAVGKTSAAGDGSSVGSAVSGSSTCSKADGSDWQLVTANNKPATNTLSHRTNFRTGTIKSWQ